jgi:hypothetical protein
VNDNSHGVGTVTAMCTLAKRNAPFVYITMSKLIRVNHNWIRCNRGLLMAALIFCNVNLCCTRFTLSDNIELASFHWRFPKFIKNERFSNYFHLAARCLPKIKESGVAICPMCIGVNYLFSYPESNHNNLTCSASSLNSICAPKRFLNPLKRQIQARAGRAAFLSRNKYGSASHNRHMKCIVLRQCTPDLKKREL